MSRESGSDQTQRTVAELLAQYGGSAESAPRRRRRRAADDEDEVQQPETAPQTIIERVLSDSGRLMAIRDDDQAPSGRRAAPEPPVVAPPPVAKPAPVAPPPAAAERTAYQPKPPVVPPVQPPQVRRPGPPATPPPAAAEQTRQVPPVRDQPSRPDMPRPEAARPEAPSRSDMPRPEVSSRLDAGAPPAPSRTNITRPPKPVPPSVQLPKPPPQSPPPREAMTEQLPRIPAKAPVDKIAALETESVLIVPPAPPRLPEPLPNNVPDAWFSDDEADVQTDLSMAPMESTAAHPGPYVDDDDSQEYAVYRAEDDYLADSDEAEDEGPAGLDDADEATDEPDEEPVRSPAKEWLIMIGQLAVGVLGGAALWLAFNFLWRSVPAAALVVALAVTVGLVLLVRKIRRADDLQTTVLAVLVGLIVTVSPAAMLLVKS
ncbi:hypothetical protein ABZ345_04775 [Lentzea sp. NPDC005914]|uniref:hypothetical protein n=1 Tax=Lentzea sp. NPDC005914 TaxID=3154572 RepID=UPI00340736DB